MRDGLDRPAFELPAANVQEIRSFLDGQSRIQVAVWVRHEQQGVDAPLYDHHLVLGVADEDWESGDMAALERGLELPALDTREPTWLDIFPVSEVDALRAFGTVLWEQTSPGADPLDYRLTYEPFVPDPAAAERFTALLAEQPAVRCVGATVETLWRGDDRVKRSVCLYVDGVIRHDVLPIAVDAARTSVLAGWTSHSATLGRPKDGAATILYEAR
jgi:hypothetical protein